MKPAAIGLHAKTFAFMLVLLAAGLPCFAQAGSLYGASVEESAILVRVLNAGAPGPVTLQVGAQKLVAQAAGQASPYRPIAADIYMLGYLGKSWEFLPDTGSYYTIVAGPSGLTFFKDVRHGDATRAQLYFYNLGSSGTAELRTADGSITLVAALPPGESAQVAVNPVSVSVAAFRSGKKAGDGISLRLVRGSSCAIVLVDLAGSPRAFLVEASVAKD